MVNDGLQHSIAKADSNVMSRRLSVPHATADIVNVRLHRVEAVVSEPLNGQCQRDRFFPQRHVLVGNPFRQFGAVVQGQEDHERDAKDRVHRHEYVEAHAAGRTLPLLISDLLAELVHGPPVAHSTRYAPRLSPTLNNTGHDESVSGWERSFQPRPATCGNETATARTYHPGSHRNRRTDISHREATRLRPGRRP